MARSISKWLSEAASKYQDLPVERLSHFEFFRDPPRPQIIDSDYFFSPADGIILYQTVVEDPTDPFLEVKGELYSLQELTQSPTWDIPCMVMGTFMTFYNCVSGETIVHTSHGTRRIRDLQGTSGIIETEFGPKKYQKIVSTGLKPGIKIRTNRGREITVSPDHQFKVTRKNSDSFETVWVKGFDLQNGDFLLTRNSPHKTQGDYFPKGPNPYQALLLGMLWGDGSYSKQGQMTWYVAPHEIELLAEIEKTFKRLEYSYSLGKIFSFDFPDGIRVSFRRSYDIQGIEAEEILRKYQENLKGESLKNQGCIAKIASKYCDATGELYRPSLLYTLTSSEKELAQYLPKFQQEGLWKENLLKIGGQWGTQQIRPFLRGLFTTDGCINQDTDLIHLAGTISFANKSSALVEEIRSLLAILGINSTKSYTPNTGGFLGDGVYTLRLIGTTSRNRFLDLIGFATTKKQERLELLREIEIGNYD